ncbi:L-threonine dehydratase catabolic TdcB [Pseudovibrio axinellae]|uniref:L-threonine dehydratase catabolic TdcB n=1 Tax=Pseudovibrio axinellae TaxID=989403 RepID=A0A165Z1E7_9HYPH|nr:threonine dehydratase [Pseudovibrio axinellae]KZL19427.1 L-threonine dehydratase catabolic TdcB [Pseudovibrio axinellae]SER59543.1 threonine dehydratase [Pseudovibrio axinellae]
MSLFSLDELEAAHTIVQQFVPQTPAYAWPLLKERTGVDVYIKHENHTPTGSFKARGGFIYIDTLMKSGAKPNGVVTATRGNHGQSVALGATRNGIPAYVVVPEGNSLEKNAAMRAFGAQVIIAGKDFDESRAVAQKLHEEHGYHSIPSFHKDLVKGVSTYALELFQAVQDLDVVYVPIGMGSGICSLITVRDLLGLKTKIIGVCAQEAPAFALSFSAGKPVKTETANTFADGMACRDPQPEALEIILKGAEDVVMVSDRQIAEAMAVYYTDTHNLAEGAGAAALAALMANKHALQGKRASAILTGGNIDLSTFLSVMNTHVKETKQRLPA